MIVLLYYVTTASVKKVTNTIPAVPVLFQRMSPSCFTVIAFAAIAIGALAPAAIMAIASANLFTRNIWVPFLDRNATPAREAAVAKVASLAVKAGAVAFIIVLSPQFSVNLQLLGGVWILQTFPAIVFGLYTRF